MAEASDHDIEVARAIGAMGANIETLLHRQDSMEKKIDAVVAMTNRWKGATALLIVVGGLLGYLGNYFLKFMGKA